MFIFHQVTQPKVLSDTAKKEDVFVRCDSIVTKRLGTAPHPPDAFNPGVSVQVNCYG